MWKVLLASVFMALFFALLGFLCLNPLGLKSSAQAALIAVTCTGAVVGGLGQASQVILDHRRLPGKQPGTPESPPLR